jgi:predicted transcriptional regulator
MLRDRLSRRLQQLAQDGERDVWRLANGAIADMRRALAAA